MSRRSLGLCSTPTCIDGAWGMCDGLCLGCYRQKKERAMTPTVPVPTSSARPPDWTPAACRGEDPRTFFPNDRDDETAKSICVICPLVDACLDYALASEEHGTWGGASEWDRRRIKRNRARERAALEAGGAA